MVGRYLHYNFACASNEFKNDIDGINAAMRTIIYNSIKYCTHQVLRILHTRNEQ